MNESTPIPSSPETDPITFKDSVELGKEISPAEALEIISNFHNTPNDVTRGAFFNLSGAEETDVVIFDDSVSNGRPCLKIEIFDNQRNHKVFSLIDAITGQPIQHIS